MFYFYHIEKRHVIFFFENMKHLDEFQVQRLIITKYGVSGRLNHYILMLDSQGV